MLEPQSAKSPKISLVFIFFVILFLGVMAGFVAIRLFRIVMTANMPSSSMSPTIPPNASVTVERFTYWFRKPQRGDVVMFKTDGLVSLPQNQFWVKRVIGLPGEQITLSNTDLYINGQLTILTNSVGPIVFRPPRSVDSASLVTNLTIPSNNFFLIGDNTTNSVDSRIHGSVPRSNIVGHVIL